MCTQALNVAKVCVSSLFAERGFVITHSMPRRYSSRPLVHRPSRNTKIVWFLVRQTVKLVSHSGLALDNALPKRRNHTNRPSVSVPILARTE